MRLDPGDLDILARTIFLEARGEFFPGKVAIAQVVFKRVSLGHDATVEAACLRPKQFSGWNKDKANAANLKAGQDVTLEDKNFRDCYRAILSALDGPDITKGATHYFNPKLASPKWARGKKPCVVIGNHAFFNNVD